MGIIHHPQEEVVLEHPVKSSLVDLVDGKLVEVLHQFLTDSRMQVGLGVSEEFVKLELLQEVQEVHDKKLLDLR